MIEESLLFIKKFDYLEFKKKLFEFTDALEGLLGCMLFRFDNSITFLIGEIFSQSRSYGKTKPQLLYAL